ncbi:MAG: asparagine synthase C-terminal domain-containing protein [Candidatus Tectomicrobia bacterium]|uniref:asparagine synthase (glutamine-hydrolyzing) n=1 Tax=Tectimicrobiota bacterium TaxID=2528274 RepID=A0A932I0U1_UNCTE|nr:asparagine synthase C-terminal domain-containing protein [Candidatus Tectomicrobia bacterium]
MASLSGALRRENGAASLAWGEDCRFQAAGDAQAAVLGPARRELPAEALALAARPGDAEAILRAHLLAGMGFSFAVWEGGRLTLGADPWGLQTLYYREADAGVRFSDRLADLARPGEEKLHLASCEHYMRYFTVPPGRTLLGGVRRVCPGERLVVSAEGITAEPFIVLGGERLQDPIEARWQLRESVEEAVAAAADLPPGEAVGLLLSGGADSTALLALLRQVRGSGPIVAIHAGDEGSPDRDFARAVAERHAAKFVDLTLTGRDAWESLVWIVGSMEAPGGNASAVASCRAFSQAREMGLRRVISGLGADEAFGGHGKHLLAPWWPWMSRLPLSLRKPLARWGRTPALRAALAAEGGPAEMHRAMYCLMEEEAADRLRGGLARFAQPRPEGGPGHPPDYSSALLQVDLDQWLRAALAPMAGALAAANGLELALPLASVPLLRLSAAMPLSWKVRGRSGKHIFRQALEDLLPAEIRVRSRKGFTVPSSEWLRGGLGETARQLLDPGRVERWCLLDKEGPGRLLQDHLAGRADWGLVLWGWMTFSEWHDRFFPPKGGM